MINRGIYFFSFRTTESADSSMIESNQSEVGINNSLQVFLVERNSSDYIDVVPKYWLGLGKPEPNVHLYFSIVFLTICIPGNLSQLLVMLAYTRYVPKYFGRMCLLNGSLYSYNVILHFR